MIGKAIIHILFFLAGWYHRQITEGLRTIRDMISFIVSWLYDDYRRYIALYILTRYIRQVIEKLNHFWYYEYNYRREITVLEKHLYRVKKLKREWEFSGPIGRKRKLLGLRQIKLLRAFKNKLFVFYLK